MDDELRAKAEAFAKLRKCTIGEELGTGTQGIVVVLKSENEPAETALKIHSEFESFQRECEVYDRLCDVGLFKLLGCNVPQVLSRSEDYLAIEMTIVKPPFVVDFASARLDWPPEYSDEIWEERNAKWAHEFGADWDRVQEILAELEEYRIFYLDPSPRNICFR